LQDSARTELFCLTGTNLSNEPMAIQSFSLWVIGGGRTDIELEVDLTPPLADGCVRDAGSTPGPISDGLFDMMTPGNSEGRMFMSKVRLLFALVMAACMGIPLAAQHSYGPADVEDGGKLFRTNCVSCHGPEGTLVDGVDLGHGKFRRAANEDEVIRIIQDGIPGTAMPPNNFTDFQAGTILAYLSSVASSGRTSMPNGDAARGEAIFEGKGGCAGCHRVYGVGSRVGPDLSDVGALRRVAEIERSLLEPNAEVLPQNRYYRVRTKAGETVTGRLLNEDSFSVQILDTKERLLSFQRTDLREAGFLGESPMPSFRDKLSEAERADVITYLLSLKGF
jgi:cytochrome c oxidase cbb3-type subunit III